MSSIGEPIKILRKEEDMTQREFAGRLSISQSYLSGIEKGNELPADRLLKLVCLEFGIRSEWLNNGEGEMYDTFYENNKIDLVEISNDALLDIMLLFSSKSNVE